MTGQPPRFFVPPLRVPVRRFGDTSIDFSRRIAVMAVVNRTPDSFFDKGKTFELDAAVDAAVAAVDAGADIIDIGGVKFAPGPALSAREEADRVVPVVEGLLGRRPNAVISVDTFQPLVAERATEAGALIINDTTGLQNEQLASIVADSGAHLVITHSLAKPRQPLPHPRYDDVTAEVVEFLAAKVARAIDLGVPGERIIIDPGHDLNKNSSDSLTLTRELSEVAALGYPTLAAVSNKDFVGESIEKPRHERLAGSLAAAVASALAGARIVRMHHVAESVDAMRMTEAILGFRVPPNPVHNM